MNTAQPEALRLAELLDGTIPTATECDEAAAELRRQHALLNTPELLSFRDGVVLEAAHQRERWGNDHDGGKTPEDWFWLIGYLAGRSLSHHKEAERLTQQMGTHPGPIVAMVFEDQIKYHREKAVHHCITAAAACANWHAAVLELTNMRPGVDPDSLVRAAGEVA